ncbi:MAG: N-acetylmuramoyl-L-alanine amidase [Deltaproteobacteria bacterium]|nr:N-acetylmuramoyl-L-alanine amidase [Deltaproteobacteria bacterium]
MRFSSKTWRWVLFFLTFILKADEGETRTGVLKAVRYSTDASSVRVVMDVNQKIQYQQNRLEVKSGKGIVERVYIDLSPCRLDPAIEKEIPIDQNGIQAIRVAQFDSNTVRVVLDLKERLEVKTFSLSDPFRVVLELPISNKEAAVSQKVSSNEGIRVIVIDPGHGGKDTGAIGSRGTREKNVVLTVSQLLAKELQKKLSAKIVLTRNKDVFIPLEERAAIANRLKADLFISVHANSARNRSAHGIETYYLDFAKDKRSREVAARENASASVKRTDLEVILNDLIKTYKGNESPRLAENIQDSLVENLKGRYSSIRDLGVKHAPFYVLVGAQMPSVLVEIEFVSHPNMEKRLQNSSYLQAIAQSIAEGILDYTREPIGTAMY